MNELSLKQKARIELGIEFLNTVNPGWYKHIVLSVFDIDSIRRCVLGQVYGGFYTGLDELKIDSTAAGEFGFYPHPEEDGESYRVVKNEYWKQRIRELKAA